MALSSQQYFIREKLPSAESLNYPVPGNSFVNGSNLSSFFFLFKMIPQNFADIIVPDESQTVPAGPSNVLSTYDLL